jgi:hypothetical protein
MVWEFVVEQEQVKALKQRDPAGEYVFPRKQQSRFEREFGSSTRDQRIWIGRVNGFVRCGIRWG